MAAARVAATLVQAVQLAAAPTHHVGTDALSSYLKCCACQCVYVQTDYSEGRFCARNEW